MPASTLARRVLALFAALFMLASVALASPVPSSLTAPFGGDATPVVVDYAQVLKAARSGHVNTATVDSAGRWVAAVDDAGHVVAARIPEPEGGSDFGGDTRAQTAAAATPSVFTLSEWLRARHVTVLAAGSATAAPAASGMPAWVVPLGFAALMITVCAFVFLQRRNPARGGHGGAASHGKMRKNALVETPASRFADVAGCDEAVEELSEVVTFLSEPDRFARVGARMPKGVILHGPPGTGKTLLAKAVAGEAGTAFFAVSGSDFVDTFVGVGAARVRDLFTEARKAEKGAIIFFDEIDAIGRQRGGGGSGSDSEREATLNQLLVELDGFGDRERVVVMAATNRVDMLDQALTRPGRFDRRVQVGLPAEAGRREILGLYADGKPIEDEAALDGIAKVTAGFSGADLANLLNEAAIMAARDGRDSITRADLDEGMLRAIAGPEKRDRKLAPGELEQIAWHEAGHCLAAELCPTHTKTQRVTIAPRGDAGGLALYGTEDRALTSPQRLHERMIVAMAGRAAEQIAFGSISSGAANDLEQSTKMARQAVEKLGFSTRIGQIAMGGGYDSPTSDATRNEVEAEITSMVDAAYRDAVALLQEHREHLDALAESLLRNEQIDRDEIERITGHVARAEAPAAPRMPEFARARVAAPVAATPRPAAEPPIVDLEPSYPSRTRQVWAHAPRLITPAARALGRAAGALAPRTSARRTPAPPRPARPGLIARFQGRRHTQNPTS